MNIVSFCPYYPPHIGGLEKYAEELHQNLIATGHHLIVITSNIPPSPSFEQNENITIIRFPAWEIIFNYPIPLFWHPGFWRVLKQVWQNKPDIIFSTTRFFLTSPIAMMIAKAKRTPWLHIEHGSDYVLSDRLLVRVIARLYDETIGRLIFKLASQNIASSQSAAAFIAKFDHRAVSIIYRGMPYHDIDHIPPARAIRQRFHDQTIIVFAGRFISSKGIPDLVEALAQVNQEKIITLLLGDGPAEKTIRAIIAKHNLTKNVLLLGPQTFTATIGILKAADIMVNPSYNEGLPTIVLEAAACQTAIIATDVGGTAEIITHKKSGLIIPPGHPNQLSQALTTLITKPLLRTHYSNYAAQEIRRKFNWTQAMAQYETLLKTAIKEND